MPNIRSKDKLIIGLAEWEKQITSSLPNDLESSLSAIEKIEQEPDRKEHSLDGDV